MEPRFARAGAAAAWDLVGRDGELARIEVALSAASPRAGAALVGPPGVGKTRLAREALGRAVTQGCSVGWVSATESARGIPLGAFANLLSTVSEEETPSIPATALTSALRHLTGSGRHLVLGIDDAHLLDDVSAVLIHQLVLGKSAHIVATMRAGRQLPDAVASLIKDGQIDRLEIAGLSEAAMDQLIDMALGGPVDRRTRRGLRRTSQGNPLYLRQLVDGGLDDAWLKLNDGLWQAPEGLSLPAALSELVAQRVGAVSEDTGVLLDLLAIAEPLTLALVDQMVDPAATEAAESSGLIAVERVSGDAALVRLAHPLYGDARRALLGTTRARRLRRELTKEMADPRWGHSNDTLRRAMVAIEGDAKLPLGLLLDAVQMAAALMDVSLADRLARASLQAGAGFETQAYIAHLSALTPGGDPAAELDRLTDMASNDLERARAAVMRIAHLAWEENQPESAEAELARAVAALEDLDAIAHVEAIGTQLTAQRGRPREAVAAAERLLANPQLGGDAVMMATSGLVSGRYALGKVDGLQSVVDRALAHPSTLANGVFRGPLLATQALGLIAAGYLDDAEEAIRRFLASIQDAGPVSAIAALLLGRMELARGRPLTALPLLQEARSGFTHFGGWRYLNQIALTMAQALSGTVDAAESALRELNDHVHPTMRFWEPERLIAGSLVASRQGASSDALALCAEAVESARTAGEFALEVIGLQQLLHLGSARHTERLETLVSLVDGPRVHLALAHSRALADSDALALAEASNGWQQCGDVLAAATAAVQSFRFADSRGGADDRHLAASIQRHAAELIALSESAWNPELSAFTQPLPLTAREREVVSFAGHGLSNKEIATRLHVSVRTVEGHIYRATAKLGMTRAELTRVNR